MSVILNRTFPIIKHIDDVLPVIKGRSEFIVAEKDGYTCINYAFQDSETFPALAKHVSTPDSDVNTVTPEYEHMSHILRECRGLLFCNTTGELLRRGFHKFFNVNEKEETHESVVPFEDFVIMDKLDGSMVTPFLLNGNIRWATKAGITDTSMRAEVFVAKNPKYLAFAKLALDQGYTLIFEWMDSEVPIVVRHTEDSLVLTAIRNMETGVYHDYWALRATADEHGIPVCNYMNSGSDLKSFLEATKGAEGIEGFVMRYDSGEMLKVKCDWYLQIHRTKDALGSLRKQVTCWIDGSLDDLMSVLPDNEKERVSTNISTFKKDVDNYVGYLKELHADMHYHCGGDRKTFAVDYVSHGKVRKHEATILFTVWDKTNDPSACRTALMNMLGKNLGTEKAFNEFYDLMVQTITADPLTELKEKKSA